MRYAFIAAPFLAAAVSATTTSGVTLVPELSTSNGHLVTVTSTFTFSNAETTLLTQTNSNGIITGTAAPNTAVVVTSQPAAATSMPAVATIPAGLSPGLYTFTMNVSSTVTSFTASVGSSSTTVLSAATSKSSGAQNGASSASGSGSGSMSGSATGSAASSSSTGAAPTNMVAAGVVGIGALVAALL